MLKFVLGKKCTRQVQKKDSHKGFSFGRQPKVKQKLALGKCKIFHVKMSHLPSTIFAHNFKFNDALTSSVLDADMAPTCPNWIEFCNYLFGNCLYS